MRTFNIGSVVYCPFIREGSIKCRTTSCMLWVVDEASVSGHCGAVSNDSITVSSVTNVQNVANVENIEEIANITSVDTVDEVTHVTEVEPTPSE